MYLHPTEFIDESNEDRIINKRVKNIVAYFFQDWLRAQLKVKNLGPSALPLYEKHIKYFNGKNYKFITIKDYCKIKRLI